MPGGRDDVDRPPSLWEDLKDIWSKATLLAFVFTLPTLTLAGLVTQMLDPVKPLIEIVFGTWPLVCSATIVIMMLMRGSFADMNGLARWWAIVLALGVPYAIAFFSGAGGYTDPRGAETRSWVQLLHPMHAAHLAYNVVLFYFSAFGLVRMAAAIVCGGFLAWAFQFRLLPHVHRLTAKAG